jgi:ATP-dependent RNA helicase DDX24/MAK5
MLPTRELAVQVKQVIKKVLSQCADTAKYRFRTCLIAGGFAVEKQSRELRSSPDILIATAGRLWDLIEAGQNPVLRTLCKSHFLIFDEIDRILELGQYKELERVLKYIEDP